MLSESVVGPLHVEEEEVCASIEHVHLRVSLIVEPDQSDTLHTTHLTGELALQNETAEPAPCCAESRLPPLLRTW